MNFISQRTSSNPSRPLPSNNSDDSQSTAISRSALLMPLPYFFQENMSERKGLLTRLTSRRNRRNPTRTSVLHNMVVAPRIVRQRRRKEMQQYFGKKTLKQKSFTNLRQSVSPVRKKSKLCCKNWTFVFDPSGQLSYYWSMFVSCAFLYNLWIIFYRAGIVLAFQEIKRSTLYVWMTLDYTADLIYVLDIFFHLRTGYLDEGVLQTHPTKLRIHYLNSSLFYLDCLCLLPLDFLYFSFGFHSMFRIFRLIKVYQFMSFLDRTERHTNYPNIIRSLTLLHHLCLLFHWNACIFYVVVNQMSDVAEPWQYDKPVNSTITYTYLHSLYLSTLILCNLGHGTLRLKSEGEYAFAIIEMISGLLLFATILGHVANIVANVSIAKRDFQTHLDNIKTYLSVRDVSHDIQEKVIRWFDYMWLANKSTDEEKVLSLLPSKLKAEIAIHVHMDTLKRVDIFQNTEVGFVCQLVLRLKPVLFSPGDYICRKGEVGKEMYVVNSGFLNVVSDDGKESILATLSPGSYFGEISILNMGPAGNRRTASVKSVGYSDLFILSKKDLWEVLAEYPAARVRIESIAVKRLEKYKKSPLEAVAIGKWKSSPGLLESAGRISLSQTVLHESYKIEEISENNDTDDHTEPLLSEAIEMNQNPHTFDYQRHLNSLSIFKNRSVWPNEEQNAETTYKIEPNIEAVI